MSDARYYVQLTVGDTYGDSTCEQFYPEQSHSSLSAAQEWCAQERLHGWNNWYEATIYECRDNLMTPLITCDYYEGDWKPVSVTQIGVN